MQSAMSDQMRQGDTFGVWTYNVLLKAGEFPMQRWETKSRAGITHVTADSAPTLINPGTLTIDELKPYTNFLVASDSDLPTNSLTFGLVAPFISGVQLVTNGYFRPLA